TFDYHARANLLLLSPAELRGGGGGGAMETVTVSADAQVGMAFKGRQIANLPVNGRSYLSFALLTPGSAGTTKGPEPIRLRENFNALAVFAPAVRTDANGRAQVQVRLPDNLTRYRVMAVAVAGGKQSGSGESAITARLPLMVRASAPRFLTFGDMFAFA